MPGFAADARPMLTGFAACVDKRIDLHAIAPALGREPGGQGFFAELMTRAKAGRGGEVLIDWPTGPQFLDRFAKPDGIAIGGTSAQAAWTFACLGAPVVMALSDRSARQLAPLHHNVKLIGDGGALVSTGDVRPAGAGKPAHYIVEYTAGRPLPGFTPDRSTRIIVRFADEDLEHDPLFERYGRALGVGARVALLSSSNSVNANRLPKALEWMASFALAWKEAGMTVHLELGEYPVPGALEATLQGMAGSVTSIGLNFNELRSIGVDPAALEAQMTSFAERHRLTRLVVHADLWALALTREDPERELDALAMGCLLGLGARRGRQAGLETARARRVPCSRSRRVRRYRNVTVRNGASSVAPRRSCAIRLRPWVSATRSPPAPCSSTPARRGWLVLANKRACSPNPPRPAVAAVHRRALPAANEVRS